MTTEKTNQFIGMLDNVSYELASKVYERQLANRQWHVGDRFTYIDKEGWLDYGTVIEVRGNEVIGRYDWNPDEDVIFHRCDPYIAQHELVNIAEDRILLRPLHTLCEAYLNDPAACENCPEHIFNKLRNEYFCRKSNVFDPGLAKWHGK